ncbi:hypothetical protein [Aureibacter tunicatorum]|uniref:EF-hand domain-containing protein n=1 Tax=Aureibacter tunicatorum TaxID=866807 RepID=A0AAE3XS57_9BACT|nr:hypothetical protein [Aureibacter tunicatorum]MDR6241550.1 hypothetical protein [Aureibacter tunicatorum]
MKKLFLILSVLVFISCDKNKLDKKGFAVATPDISNSSDNVDINEIKKDSLLFETRPSRILKTYHKDHRLTPIFKVNQRKDNKERFIGSLSEHNTYYYDRENEWNGNYMPGLSAVYGYNFVNISHFDHSLKSRNKLFESPVLIRTLYYPAFSKDTLNSLPISRNYYLVSVYDEDTNKDGFINLNDLRRLYYFDIHGQNKTLLIPANYSVMSSQYDSGLDYMYIYAKKDENQNGKSDSKEKFDIFWIDLKNPLNRGVQYD